MPKKHLTLTNDSRTMSKEVRTVESGEKKLIDERERLRRQRIEIDRRISAIDTALEIMDIRVAVDPFLVPLETRYADEIPFRGKGLSEACLTILTDYRDGWLDKNHVEYLLTVGGYQFTAKDPTNSVEITLRRLAAEGHCEVQKHAGNHGNRYRDIKWGKESNAVENPGATTE